MSELDTSRPVLLLGGSASTLAAVRSLGRVGLTVYCSGSLGCRAMYSRYCAKPFAVPSGTIAKTWWRRILLERPEAELEGALILVGCDESLEFLEENAEALRRKYLIEDFQPELRRAMLDKLETLRLARAAGVPTPSYWDVKSPTDVLAVKDELRFPVMVKPHDSHAFMKEFGRKLFIVEDSLDEVVEKVRLCASHGHAVMVVEMIPGPDDQLSSYYTYRTPGGDLLYDYTKSVIRRWPVNRGGACFHQSEWLPETAEMGRRLFEGIGWQGIGNVEFKRDPRDGKLKIIEVNGRLTAGHPLVTRSGAPIDLAIYCHLTGQEVPEIGEYSQSLRQWDPVRDFMAFRQLHGRGELSFLGWLRSIVAQRWVLPFFSFDDPGPALSEARGLVSRKLGAIFADRPKAVVHAD